MKNTVSDRDDSLKAGLIVEEGSADKNQAAMEATTDKPSDKKASKELGGPKGLEPTRYGDWESKGRCYDF